MSGAALREKKKANFAAGPSVPLALDNDDIVLTRGCVEVRSRHFEGVSPSPVHASTYATYVVLFLSNVSAE